MSHLIEASIAHYQKALILAPDRAILHEEIGNLYIRLGKFKQATYYCLKAIKIDPKPRKVYYYLKYALDCLKLFSLKIDTQLLAEGIKTLEKGIKNQPEFLFSQVVLATLYAAKGDLETAEQCLRQASFQQISLSHPKLVKSSWDETQKRQPDFMILGFPKCGTTSLYAYLTAHPQILSAVMKEIHYFDFLPVDNLDYYLAHFPQILDRRYLTGEASPSYILSPNLARKIWKSFPNVKLIVLLRNPIESTISLFYQLNRFEIQSFNQSLNKIKKLDTKRLQERLDLQLKVIKLDRKEQIKFLLKQRSADLESEFLGYVTYSLYLYFLKEWLTVFPREQILILKSEDLFFNPATTLKRVYDFLGLPDSPQAKYRNYNPGSYPPISDNLRRQLAEFFRPYNRQLEDYLGMKFNWE